ncbi:MAG: hypothetical protein H7Y18_06835 [Clostridiaceae bacterium]|nr:hypothetical protein [Clostridiaceae bacterium]
MKYIGHFMRINVLTKENIKNQLFFFSKESLHNAVMHSKCGITIPSKEVRTKNIPKNDINIFNSFSPLLCIYKKANCKLVNVNDSFIWNEEKFKKEINITGNILMTLSLLELTEYLNTFRRIDDKKYALSSFYLSLAKAQLDFYTSNFRNKDGVFVDKLDLSDNITEDFKFEEKDKGFNLGDQAFVMAAFYKYYMLSPSKSNEDYKSFASDILAMFTEFKEELYEAPYNQFPKLCLGIYMYYSYSKDTEALKLLIDLLDFAEEKHQPTFLNFTEKNLTDSCLFFINYFLIYKSTGLSKFKELSDKISTKLIELYDPETGIFLKVSEKKELVYYCDEIMLYLTALILLSEENNTDDLDMAIVDIYKTVLINSGIISSWPEAPFLDDAERYKNFSMEESDFLEDHNFRMESIATPETCQLAPVFIKSVLYNKRKSTFLQNKLSFDSSKNMFINFIVISLFPKK